MMARKTANLYIRMDPEIKEQAERILSELGVPASNAINMFYRQIILHRGIPFEISLPVMNPVNLSDLSPEQFSEELEKGYSDMKAGKVRPVRDVFADIRRDYGL
jgi:DNA-damage-inducible protein J